MDDLLDDDDLEFEKLDHSFQRKRPTEASWDSDDELLQEDHIPVKKTKLSLSDDDLDEDALLGDSDNEDFSTYEAAAEDQGVGDLPPVEAPNIETNDSYEYGVDDQIGDLQEDYVGGGDGDFAEQLDDQIEEYQGVPGDQTGVETGEISGDYSGMLDNTQSEEWGVGEADVGGDYEEEQQEGEEEYQEEGGDNFEEGYNEDAVAEEEEEVAAEDEDAAILEDAIELEPGMDDILDIEDFDDSLIEDVPEDNTSRSGGAAKVPSSTPKMPVREKPAQVQAVSKPKEQPSSQPVHTEEKEEEEGSDTKEDIPSSDSDEDDDDDNTRARFKSERQPVTVKVSGVSKRKDIPETLEITAQVQQTLDDYARQKEEQQWTKRNRGRGGRGFRGNRGNRGNHHQGPPPMMGMHPGNMGPRFPGHMGPRFPGDMRHRFPGNGPPHFHGDMPHYMGDMPPRPAFQQQEVIRGPPAGHLRGGRFDFEPYHPGKASPNQVPQVQQGPGQEESSSNQGGQRSSSPLTQAPPAQQSSQPGAVTTSQPQSSVSKKIHINPHFKGQVQVPSQQVVASQSARPPVHSTPPTHSQYQPSSTASTHYQPPDSYPNQYPTQPYSQHGTAPGHPPHSMQPRSTSHSQRPPPLMEQQHPASYGDPHRHHGDQQSGHWMPPSSQHPSSGAWTQPGRPSPVSVTWSHQQGPPRPEFAGHQPHHHSPQFTRAQTPQERIPPHQQFQSPRGMQPNQMRPHSEPQHRGGPRPRQQGPTYHGQGPQSARQGAGQRFPAPNNQPSGQFTSQQHRPQGTSVQPSTPNQANTGKILPSPKRLIEEASKKATKVDAAKPVKDKIDEDAETRKLRIQLEEQKKLREMILQRKEARRQQLAASKQAELKKRLSAKKAKTSAETSDTQEQQPPPAQQQQQRQQPASQGAPMPVRRHSTTTQQPPNQTGSQAIPPASINRNNSAQSQQNLPRQVAPQQWAGGPGQPRPTSQPRAQLVRHEISPLGKQGPPRQLFQQQTWQQQQNVKVLVDMDPQPIPTVGAGGRVQPRQPVGGVGAANRPPSGQIRGQQQNQVRGQQPGQTRGQHPGQIRGQQPGQIRGQQPGQIRGQQPGQIRGQQPGQIRGRQPGQIRGQQPGQIRGQQPGQIRGQHPGQIRGQHPGQIQGQQPNQMRGHHQGQVRGQQPQGPQNNMGRGRGRGQPQQKFSVPRFGQPQGNGPRTQGPRPYGQGGPQFRGPRPQGMAPRPQGPGGAGRPQGGPRPQKRSVKDRIGVPQQGPAQTQQAPQQVQRRVVQQQSPQQAQKTTNNQGAGNQPGQPGNKRTVVQNLTPQQRLLQQKQQRLAQRPQGTSQAVRVLPPQPQRVVKQLSAESPEVVRGPLGILIDGLSASTSKKNLMKMLQSCGPIKNVEIVPSERRAFAKFCRPEDAMSFQTKFHRHMIDLATINVSLIPD